MKNILLILIFISILTKAQDINRTVIDEKTNKPMLIGLCDRIAFTDTSFSWWFEPEYEFYEPEQSVIETIRQIINDEIEVTIVLGTWCSDSKREVPHFLRILDELNFNQQKITIFGVDRKKTIEGYDISNLEIEFVPTFILYRNGIEIGRIVETPLTTLEEDIKDILQKE